jgi:hypothetical protein
MEEAAAKAEEAGAELTSKMTNAMSPAPQLLNTQEVIMRPRISNRATIAQLPASTEAGPAVVLDEVPTVVAEEAVSDS